MSVRVHTMPDSAVGEGCWVKVRRQNKRSVKVYGRGERGATCLLSYGPYSGNSTPREVTGPRRCHVGCFYAQCEEGEEK